MKKDCSFSTVSTPRSLAPPMSRNCTPWCRPASLEKGCCASIWLGVSAAAERK